MSVGTIAATLHFSQSATSQHLARLREDGVVATRREATSIFYVLSDDKAARLIATGEDISKRPLSADIG